MLSAQEIYVERFSLYSYRLIILRSVLAREIPRNDECIIAGKRPTVPSQRALHQPAPDGHLFIPAAPVGEDPEPSTCEAQNRYEELRNREQG